MSTYEKPLSQSAVKMWRNCPRRWYGQYVENIRSPTSPYAQRGTDLHAELENFFSAPIKGYPSHLKPLAPWQDIMEHFAFHEAEAEAHLAVDEHWKEVPYNDPSAWFRGKIDLIFRVEDTVYIIDFKTGRQYPDHIEQGRMYVALCQDEDVKEYSFADMYLDNPLDIVEEIFTPAQRLEEIEYIMLTIDRIRNATEWIEKPGNHCRFCPLSWRNGGRCVKAP
jgi:hypothetical protein